MSRLVLASLVSLIALTGCKTKDDFGNPPTNNDARLERFANCGALQVGLVDAYTEELVRWRYGYWAVPMAEDGVGGVDSNSDAGPSDYSTTNVQEEGVDEPDMVKTDGNFIYVVDPYWWGTASIHVVKSWPVEDSAEVATIDLDGYPYSMFLDGDRLLVYQYVYDLPARASEPQWASYGTRLSVFDVSDPSAPEELRQIDLEGWLTDGRMVGDDVYTVVNSYSYMPSEVSALLDDTSLGLPDNTNYWELSDAEQEQIREEARRILKPEVSRIVARVGAEELMPRMWDHLPGEEVDGTPIADCGDVYHPQGVSEPSMLTVAHLDASVDGGDLSTTTLMANGWEVYASQDALYVSQSSWWWWWGWGDLDQNTQIHKFELDGANTAYVASGEVPGWTRDSYAFDEQDGHLRVASSDFWWWGCGWIQDSSDCIDQSTAPANNLFVLDQDGDELKVVGEVTGIAPGEQITASRFMGDIGFMVTALQVDPLWTLDLSDPTDPKVAGELEMPGYNAYLHPVGTDKLLAVGMGPDGSDTGNHALKVDLFDISDLANPTLADEITVSTGSYSYSDALWDHHAFTYHRDNVSVPLYTYDWDNTDGSYAYFSGLWSVQVDPDAGTLTEVGRISHQDLVDDSACVWDQYVWPEQGYTHDWSYCDDTDYGWYWYASVRRSVVIEAHLFSISDYGVKVTALDDPSNVEARVLFYPAQ